MGQERTCPLVAPADNHRRTLLLGKVPPTMRRTADHQEGRVSQRPCFRRIELGQSIVQLGKRENCRWRQGIQRGRAVSTVKNYAAPCSVQKLARSVAER